MNTHLESWFPKNRLETLTDSIYAVALTLLVLDLRVPPGALDSTQFYEALREQLPNALTWVLSFWVLIIYWESQVRVSRYIEHINSIVLRLDLVHLGLITLLPFSTSLIGEHSSLSMAVVIYTANLWLISGIFCIKAAYIQRNSQLVGHPDPSGLLRSAKLMFGGMTVALLLSTVAPGWNLLAILASKLLINDKANVK